MQAATGLQIMKSMYDPTTRMATALLANAYTAITSSDPGTRYLLASFQFDLSSAVPGADAPPSSCGGLDAILCAQISNASWLTLDGQEIQWEQGLFFVSGNDRNHTWCGGVVPAQPKTWGALKSQYRD